MNPLLIRAFLRILALFLESFRWLDPGTFENILGDATLEPLFILVISEVWFWLDKRKDKHLTKPTDSGIIERSD